MTTPQKKTPMAAKPEKAKTHPMTAKPVTATKNAPQKAPKR